MSNERRLRNALQGFVKQVRDSREYGTLGRVNADGTVTLVVAERPDHVYVRMNAGALITLPNVGKGRVALRAGLPVQMIRLANGDLVLDGQNDRLLEGDENAPDVEADLAYHAYLIEALTTQLAAVDFLVLPDTPADYVGAAGMVATVNATEDALVFEPPAGGTVDSVNGQTGTVVLDSDDIAEGTVNYFISDAELVKLAGIETAADVTDAANVGAAVNTSPEKVTPVDADKVGIINSVGSALSWVSWANLKATLKSYLDTLYVALTGNQTIAGVKTFANGIVVQSATANTLEVARTTTGTALLYASAAFKAISSGIMADGFGTGFFFRAQDSDGVENNLALIGGIRDGADNTGRFRLFVYLLGVAQQVLDITSKGWMGIGTTVTEPQGIVHVHDGTGGLMFVSKTGVNGTTQTIIPDGTGDATKACLLSAVASDGTNPGVRAETVLTSGGTTTIVCGTTTATFTLAASGALTVVRTAGTGTLSIAIKLLWI